MAALLPVGAFKKTPDFGFLCTARHALIGGQEVRSRIIAGARPGVSDAMREWAGLGWYELAAYTVLRGRCCAKAEPLRWGFELACPIDETLVKLEAAARANDRAAVKTQMGRYAADVLCLSRFGQAKNFRQSAAPSGGVPHIEHFLLRAGFSRK